MMVKLKNIFGTYLCRQSALVMELRSIFLFLIWVSMGLFDFLDLLELFLWFGSSSKTFGGPTYIDERFFKVQLYLVSLKLCRGGGG